MDKGIIQHNAGIISLSDLYLSRSHWVVFKYTAPSIVSLLLDAYLILKSFRVDGCVCVCVVCWKYQG